MGFIDNIIECLGGEEFPKCHNFRAVMFGDRAVYIENVTGIISYEKQEISLSIKNGRLTVKGDDLYVKKYCQGDVVICGIITAIERVQV